MSEMRSEGATELRDLVAQALEKNGTLAKIKAELRASVFLALEEQESVENKSPLLNQPLKDFLSTSEGELISCLVREYLEYFHLDYTLSVFDQETYHDKEYHYMGRDKLCQDLKLRSCDSNGPILSDVLQMALREDLRKENESYADDDSVSLEDMPNSLSENMRLGHKCNERNSVSCVETIKVTLHPKSKQKRENVAKSDASSNTSSEVDCLKEEREVSHSVNSNEELKNQTQNLRADEPYGTSTVPDPGEMKSAFDMDSLGVYEEDFQSYGSTNEGNVENKGTGSPQGLSLSEEIEEEIPSAIDDPLSSNVSGGDDTTADATISNPAGVADYMEDLRKDIKGDETVP